MPTDLKCELGQGTQFIFSPLQHEELFLNALSASVMIQVPANISSKATDDSPAANVGNQDRVPALDMPSHTHTHTHTILSSGYINFLKKMLVSMVPLQICLWIYLKHVYGKWNLKIVLLFRANFFWNPWILGAFLSFIENMYYEQLHGFQFSYQNKLIFNSNFPEFLRYLI